MFVCLESPKINVKEAGVGPIKKILISDDQTLDSTENEIAMAVYSLLTSNPGPYFSSFLPRVKLKVDVIDKFWYSVTMLCYAEINHYY